MIYYNRKPYWVDVKLDPDDHRICRIYLGPGDRDSSEVDWDRLLYDTEFYLGRGRHDIYDESCRGRVRFHSIPYLYAHGWRDKEPVPAKYHQALMAKIVGCML